MSKYADIIARLEKAEGADFQLEREIDAFCHFGRPGALDRNPPPYTASIDAAIALVERMLPGWNNSSIRTGDNEFAAYVWEGNESHHKEYLCEGSPSRCGAILLALFRALDAQETQQ